MLNLNDLKIFIQVQHHGGISQAASALGMQKSLISRRLAGLEETLKMRLFDRQGRQLVLTQAGLRVYEEYADLFTKFDEAEQRVLSDQQALTGDIVVSLPMNLVTTPITDVFADFCVEQPHVSIRTELVNRSDQLFSEAFDVGYVIDTYQFPEDDLIARPLYTIESGLFATPEFIKEQPLERNVQSLRNVPCLSGPHFRQFTFASESGDVVVPVNGPFMMDSTIAQIKAAMRGLGVVRAPKFAVADLVREGALQELSFNWPLKKYQIFFVYRERSLVPQRVRTFIDYVLENSQPFHETVASRSAA